MKKQLPILLCLLLGLAYGQTILNDTLSTDTTLRLADSPFNIPKDDTVFITASARVTIEPGVVINIDSTGVIFVEGSLRAQGTANSPIRFGQLATGLIRPFLGQSRFFLYATSGHLELEYCHFDSLLVGTGVLLGSDSTSFVRNCDISGCGVGIWAWGVNQSISNCRISHCNWGFQGESHHIDSCVFEYCDLYGIDMQQGGTISNCEISNCSYVGVELGYSTTMRSCIVHDNRVGVRFGKNYQFDPPKDTTYFFDNRCEQNQYGLEFFWTGGPIFNGNYLKIYDNAICGDTLICLNGSGAHLGNNCWCLPDSVSIASSISRKGISSSSSFIPVLNPVNTNCLPGVYPGDANRDRTCNMRDLLSLGTQFGATGPIRANATLAWQGQPATDWQGQSPDGINSKHADCDGNGIIDVRDTLAIAMNYSQLHLDFAGKGNGIPVTISPTTTGSFKRGDTVTYRIDWGDMSNAVQNAYGVTLSLQYDTSQWNSNSLRVLYPNSWLGTPNTDMLTMTYHDPVNGRLDLGWVRTDGMTRNGFGQIGSIVIVLDDDISKRGIAVNWEVLDAYAIDNQALSIDVLPEFAPVYVDYADGISPDISASLSVFPNPSHDGRLLLKWTGVYGKGAISVFDVYGKKVYEKAFSSGKTEDRIQLNGLPAGTYILKVDAGEKRMMKKLVLR